MKQSTVRKFPLRTPHSALRIAVITLVSGLALWQAADALVLKEYHQNLKGNTAVSSSSIPAGTVTHLVLDHAGLYTSSPPKSRADGQDLLFRLIDATRVPPDQAVPPTIGAPDGMFAYHGFDASYLLPSLLCPDYPGLAIGLPLDSPLTSWTLCNHASPTGTVTKSASVAERPGQFNTAAYFDGVAGTALSFPLGDLGNKDAQPQSAQSLELWMYLIDPATTSQAIVSQANDEGGQRLAVTVDGTGLKFASDSRALTISKYLCTEFGGTPDTSAGFGSATLPADSDCNNESFYLLPGQLSRFGGTSSQPCGTCTKGNAVTPITSSQSLPDGQPQTETCPFSSSSTSCTCTNTYNSTANDCSTTLYNQSSCPSSCSYQTSNLCCTVGCHRGDGALCTSLRACGGSQGCTWKTTTTVTVGSSCQTSCTYTCPSGALVPGNGPCATSVLHNTGNYICSGASSFGGTCCSTCSFSNGSLNCGSCTYTSGYLCTEATATGGLGTPISTSATAPTTGACDNESWQQNTSPCNPSTCTLANASQPYYAINPSDASSLRPISLSGTSPIPPREWVHVAIVVNPGTFGDPCTAMTPACGDSLAIYLNGTPYASVQPAVQDAGVWVKGWAIPASSKPFIIGSTAAAPIKGLVDRVAYFKTALSDADIKAHYEEGVSLNGIKDTEWPLRIHTPQLAATGASGMNKGFNLVQPADPTTAASAYAMMVDATVTPPVNPLKSAAAEWTVEFFVKPSQVGAGTLASSWDAGAAAQQFFRLELDAQGKPQLVTSAGTFTNAALGALSTTTWTHVALITDASTTRAVIDGQTAAAIQAGSRVNMSTAATPLVFGAYLGGTAGTWPKKVPSNFLNGWIDEVMFHNRALSDAEIQTRASMLKQAGGVWNAGLGLNRSALFLTVATGQTIPTTSSNYWLYYGPGRAVPVPPLVFCGAGDPTCDTGVVATSLFGKPSDKSPVVLSPTVFVEEPATITVSGTLTYSALDTGSKTAPTMVIANPTGSAWTTIRVHLPSGPSVVWDPASLPAAPASPISALSVINDTSGQGKILQVVLSASLAKGASATLPAQLKVMNFATAGKGTLWLDLDDGACANELTCAESSSNAASPLIVREALELVPPAAQVTNALDTSGNLTNRNLLRFGLKAYGGGVDPTSVTIHLPTMQEVLTADLANLKLVPWGWTGTVAGNTMTFLRGASSGTVPTGSTATELTVTGDVLKVGDPTQCSGGCLGDQLGLNLTKADLAGTGNTSATTLTATDVVSTPTTLSVSMLHKLTGYTLALDPTTALVGDTVNVTWRAMGDASVSSLVISFSPGSALGVQDGAGSVPVCQSPAPAGATPCGTSGIPVPWQVRDLISTTPGKFWLVGSDASGTVITASAPLTIKGSLSQISLASGATVAVCVADGTTACSNPTPITWTRHGTFPVDVQFAADGTSFSTIGTTTSDATTFSWEPMQTTQNGALQFCGSPVSTADCQTVTGLKVNGIIVTKPTSGDAPYVIGASGVPVPVQWSANGPTLVDLYYCTSGCGTFSSGYTLITTGGPVSATAYASSPYPGWVLPKDFANLSNAMRVRVVDPSKSTVFGESGAFAVRGTLQMAPVLPAKTTYPVGDNVTLSWSTFGGIGTVSLQYSTDGSGSSFGTPQALVDADSGKLTQNIQNTGSFSWKIPNSLVSDNLRLRVVDTPSAPVTISNVVGPLQIGAIFTFTTPSTGTERWPAGAAPPVIPTIGWNVKGQGVTQVKLEYATEPTYATWTTVPACTANQGTQGSCAWTLPNLLPPQPKPFDPTYNPNILVKLRISDATTGHPASPTVLPNSFTVFLYKVTWEVRDANNPQSFVPKLEVTDSSPWAVSAAAGDTLLGPGQVFRYYPYIGAPGVTTVWLYSLDGSNTNFSQGPTDSSPVGSWVSDRDQTRTVLLELSSADAITWNVKSQAQYNAGTTPAQVDITAWLEKSGKLINNLLGSAYIEIYNAGTLIRSIPQAVPSQYVPGQGVGADANGSFRFAWDLTQDDGSPVPDGQTYFAKVTIFRQGRTFSTGEAINIAVPKKVAALPTTSGGSSGGTGGTGTTDQALAADVSTIKNAVTQTLPQQVALAQGAIQAQVIATQGTLSTQIGGVKSDTQTLITKTDAVQTTLDRKVVPKVTAILEDPNVGLPKLQQQLTQHDADMKDAAKSARHGAILNRDLDIESGQNVTIQYRSEGGAPALNLYDPAGAPVPVPALIPSATGGIYQSIFSLSALGEYRVVVSEPASQNSNGTMDSVTLTVRAPRATAQGVTDLGAQFTGLQSQLSTIDGRLNTLISSIAVIDSNVSSTKTVADQLASDTQTLLGKWGQLDAAQLKTQLDNLSRQLGTPVQASDLQSAVAQLSQQIAAIPGALDYSTRFNQIDSALAALQTAVTSITGCSGPSCTGSGGDLTAVNNTLTQLNTQIQAMQTQLGSPAQATNLQSALAKLDGLQTDMTAVKSAMGSPAQATALQAVAGQLTAIQDAIAQIPPAADYSTQLANLKDQITAFQTVVGRPSQESAVDAQFAALTTALTDLKTTVGTPAQATALQAVASQLSTIDQLIRAIPPAADYAQQFTDLKSSLTALQTSVDSTAKDALLQSVSGKIDALQAAVAAIPPAADYSQQLTQLKTDVAQLSSVVGTPAQAAKLQQTLSTLQTVQSQIAAIPGALDYSGNFAALNDALTQIHTALDTVPKTDSSADISALKASMSAVQQTMAALPTQGATAAQVSDAITKLTTLQQTVDALHAADTNGTMTTSLNTLNKNIATLQTQVAAGVTTAATTPAGSDTLLAKLDELQKAVASAQGSGAAVSFSQSAATSAQEAVQLLHQLQAELAAKGTGSTLAPVALNQLSEKLGKVSETITVIPGKITADEIRAQLQSVVDQAKTLSSQKGYHFDSLYESTASQADDVKTVRNRVEELKVLLDVQRGILEQRLNEPVVKTWFEAGY